jgi:cholesterol transport system auxiliary component
MDPSRHDHTGSCHLLHAPARWLAPLVVLTMILLTGCSSLGVPSRNSTPVRQYLLEWQADNHREPVAGGPVLQISATRSAAGFGNSGMLYVRKPYQLERFARHRWADSPARMLSPLLVKAAEASGLFSAVSAPGTPVQADLRLDTEVLHLLQEFSDGESRVELALRATLIDVASGRQIASRSFNITEPAPATPYDGVRATNRAVARLMDELTRFLSRHTTPRERQHR